MEEKRKLLTWLLRDKPRLLAWDNFESASGIEGTEIQLQLSAEDRDILARLLKGLCGGKRRCCSEAEARKPGCGLTERYLPALQTTGPHEYYANTNCVKAMLDAVGCPMESDLVNTCYHILENAGFCTHIGQNVYKLYPALRGYLVNRSI